jgi:predicted transcriptional regulator
LHGFYTCSRLGGMARRRALPSDAEWRVLHALWRDWPASARELLERLRGETGWAYTTLKTMLTRMQQKGLVRARARGRTTLYEPALPRERSQATALHALVERVFEGAAGAVLAQLMAPEDLSASDRKRLQAWIDALDKKSARASVPKEPDAG